MIRSILHLRPAPGRSHDLLTYIIKQGIVSRALSLPGCLSAEVATSISDGQDVVVTGLWTSMEAYEGWLRSPERLQKGNGMLPLLDLEGSEVSAARLYRIEQFNADPKYAVSASDSRSTEAS